jgi:hypothetical protein
VQGSRGCSLAAGQGGSLALIPKKPRAPPSRTDRRSRPATFAERRSRKGEVDAISRRMQFTTRWYAFGPLPGHGPATPVEKTAVGINSEFIDGGQQMAGHVRGRVDI